MPLPETAEDEEAVDVAFRLLVSLLDELLNEMKFWFVFDKEGDVEIRWSGTELFEADWRVIGNWRFFSNVDDTLLLELLFCLILCNKLKGGDKLNDDCNGDNNNDVSARFERRKLLFWLDFPIEFVGALFECFASSGD